MPRPKLTVEKYYKWEIAGIIVLTVVDLSGGIKLPLPAFIAINAVLLPLVLPGMIEFYMVSEAKNNPASNEWLLRFSIGLTKFLDLIPHNPFSWILPYQKSRLATVMTIKNRLPEAEELFRQVAADLARHAGPDSIDAAIGLIDLCGTLSARGRAQEGRALADKAIAILEKHSDCPFETAAALSQLASTYTAQGETKEAIELLEKVIKQIEDAPSEGNEHHGMTQLSASLTSLGAAYIQARRYEDAWRVFKRTYTLKEKYFGIESHNVILGACNLCCAASHVPDRERMCEAAEVGEAAIVRLRKIGNTKDPLFASTINNVGSIYIKLGELDKAKRYLDEGLELYSTNLGPTHLKVSYSYLGLAELQAELKNFDLADEYCKKGLAIRRACLTGNHPEIASALELQEKIRSQRNAAEAPVA